MFLEYSDFNRVDIVILVITAFSLLRGCFRGVVKELLTLFSLLASIWLARQFSAPLSTLLLAHIQLNSSVAISFAALFIVIVTQFCFSILSVLIRKALSLPGLSLFDRITGTVFGFVRGGIIVTICLMITKGIDPLSQSNLWRESRLIPYFLVYENWMGRIFGDVWEHRENLEKISLRK